MAVSAHIGADEVGDKRDLEKLATQALDDARDGDACGEIAQSHDDKAHAHAESGDGGFTARSEAKDACGGLDKQAERPIDQHEKDAKEHRLQKVKTKKIGVLAATADDDIDQAEYAASQVASGGDEFFAHVWLLIKVTWHGCSVVAVEVMILHFG